MSIITNKRTVGFIGGDMRTNILAQLMKKNGYSIRTLGIVGVDNFQNYEVCKTVQEIFLASEVIVLPVPVTRDKVNIFAECSEFILRLSDIILNASSVGKKVILGGIIPRHLKDLLEENGHTVIDFFENSRLICNNAIATAEGALMIAMEKLQTTIISSSFAILGFGRIGSHLAKIIKALGGKVTIFARRDEVIGDAMGYGYEAVKLEEGSSEHYHFDIARKLDEVSVIYNTIPGIILNRKIIEQMHTRPLYIELASFPYGIDSKDARELEFNTIYAPSLPGRYSPISAAEYIYDAISFYLSQPED